MHEYSSQLWNTRFFARHCVNGRKYASIQHFAHRIVSQPLMPLRHAGRQFLSHRRASSAFPKSLSHMTEMPPSGDRIGSSVLQESLFRMTVMRI